MFVCLLCNIYMWFVIFCVCYVLYIYMLILLRLSGRQQKSRAINQISEEDRLEKANIVWGCRFCGWVVVFRLLLYNE